MHLGFDILTQLEVDLVLTFWFLGAMAEQGRPLEEILSTAKEVKPTQC